MAKRKWSDLSPCARRLMVAGAVVEACLKVAMLSDIRRRPAEQIRGPKWLWAPMALVNLVGPLAYFAMGRQR